MSDLTTRMGAVPEGAQAANNYACQGWQAILGEYRSLEHPTKDQQADLVARAKECLMVLEGAGMLAADDPAQALLIYENCREIARSVERTDYFDQDADDPEKWHRHSLPMGTSLELPGQKDSWKQKAQRFRDVIERDYLAAHTDEVARHAELDAEVARLEGQLAELKAEKRGKGLFNFSGKREVKERMKPVKDELSEARSQLSELEGYISGHVEARLAELEGSFVRLDF